MVVAVYVSGRVTDSSATISSLQANQTLVVGSYVVTVSSCCWDSGTTRMRTNEINTPSFHLYNKLCKTQVRIPPSSERCKLQQAWTQHHKSIVYHSYVELSTPTDWVIDISSSPFRYRWLSGACTPFERVMSYLLALDSNRGSDVG